VASVLPVEGRCQVKFPKPPGGAGSTEPPAIANRKSSVDNSQWPDGTTALWVILNAEDFLTSLRSPALILRAVLLASLPLLIAPGLYPQTPAAAPDDLGAQALKFTALYGAIEQHYVDPVDPDHVIFDGGIRGMCLPSTLSAHSGSRPIRHDEAAGAGGIGRIWIDPLRSVGKVLVLQTTQGSPSFRAGLAPGMRSFRSTANGLIGWISNRWWTF